MAAEEKDVVLRAAHLELVSATPTQPGKRAFDVVAAVLLLMLLAPLLLVVALVVLLADGRPVLFRQVRVGRAERRFTMLKFRTMQVGAHEQQGALAHANVGSGLLFKIDDDPRVTRVGRLLRRTSLDELPQLWNVARGEMSLVGPRPLPVDPADFRPDHALRHTVRPGVTGLWQIKGRGGQNYDEMIAFDLEYIATWSFGRDLSLLVRTLPATLSRAGPV